MIAAARRQNYGAAALVPGPRRPPCMVDFCVYLFYRAALALITALPLRFVFYLGKGLGFCRLAPAAELIVDSPAGMWRSRSVREKSVAGKETDRPPSFSAARRQSPQRDEDSTPCRWRKSRRSSRRRALTRCTASCARAGRLSSLLSHLGNWELFAQIVPHYFGYIRLGTVYQKLGNRHLDRFVRQQRARFGVELFDRSEGFQEAIRLLRGGGMIGILSDQHAGDHGLWTPFFGRLASTSPLPALLCKRTGAALIAASLYTDGPGKWRMIFQPGLAICLTTACRR